MRYGKYKTYGAYRKAMLANIQEEAHKITDNLSFNWALDIAYGYEKALELGKASEAWQSIGKYFYPVSLLLATHPVSRIILKTADEFNQ